MFEFPGDPPLEAQLMSMEEFLREHPRQPTQIWGAGGLVAEIPLPEEYVACDLCGEQITGNVWVVDYSRAYCPECSGEFVLRYITQVKE